MTRHLGYVGLSLQLMNTKNVHLKCISIYVQNGRIIIESEGIVHIFDLFVC